MKSTAAFFVIFALSAACSEAGDPTPTDGSGGRGSGGGAGAGSGGGEPVCDVQCGAACCETGQVCLEEPLASPSTCARECVTNSWCNDPSTPCCALLPDGGGACTSDDSP